MSAVADRCAFTAAARGDDQRGTAAPANGFLLVEQPGPWGRQAFTMSRLDPVLGAAIVQSTVGAGLRPLLMRRPGRSEESSSRRWFRAICTPGAVELRTGEAAVDDLTLIAGADAPGELVDTPVFGICTHGTHDACCAIRGRPVARALADLGADAWEVSHLGGDRFAANVLVLPWGLYYGPIGDPAALLAATTRGEIAENLRGRSTFAPAAQVAQDFARRRSGDRRIDAHRPLSVETLEPNVYAVALAAGDGTWRVVVRREAVGAPVLLTCGSRAAQRPPAWTLVSLDPA